MIPQKSLVTPIATASMSKATLYDVHELARAQMLKAGARQKKYDHNAKQNLYKIGDLVLLNAKQISKMNPKFCRSCEGPYTINKRILDLTYEIQRGSSGVLKIVYHNLLRPYFGKTGTH